MSSNNIWDQDSDDFENTSEGMKALRDAYKAAQKANRELAKERDGLVTERDSLKTSVTQATLESLTSNLPAGVKKFLARDFKNEGTEASEANVKAWLDENGADFGYDPSKATTTQTSTSETSTGQQVATDLEDEDGQPVDSSLPPEVQQALALVQRFESGQLSQNQGAVDVVKTQMQELEGKNLSAAETYQQLKALGIPVAGY